jgi:C-terminal processing protease CtpA/Prc
MRLGVRFNNSNSAAEKVYGSNGVVVRDVVKRGVFDKLDIQKYDYITKLTINNVEYHLDNFGESWYRELNVSLPLKDIIHRQVFGTDIDIHFIRDGKVRVVTMTYDFLKHEDKPYVRFLETLEDSGLQNEVGEYSNGLVVKTLRMDDVVNMKLMEYTQEHRQSEYRVVVCEIKPGSEAFQSLNFRVGTVLGKIDGEEVKGSWKLVKDQLDQAFQKGKPFSIESDKGRILFCE